METRNINITPGGTTPVIHVSQNDVGRTIILNITDGNDWYDLTGCTVKLQGTKPSGLGYTVAGTVNGHTVTIITTKQMTDEYGNIASELNVTKNDLAIGTANLILAVERDPHPEHTTDGSVEELIPTITLLMETAEAYAVGTRSGVPVASDDPAYQNNAKFYADVLGQAAANAGYMFMDIVDGDLIYTRTDNVQVDFELDDGDLYATIDES